MNRSVKRVLLLNQTFYPDHAATSQQLTDLAMELVGRGNTVIVLSDRRSYDDRQKLHARRESYRGVHIHRIMSTAFGKSTPVYRAIDYLSFNLGLLFKLLSLPKFDIVVSLTSPPWISFFGALFSRFNGSKFIHWAMDINPDEAVVLEWVKRGSSIHKILEWTARFTYSKSSSIIALDHFMAERIQNKGADPKKIVILPPWAHDDDITYIPHSKNPFRERHKLVNKFVVMYSGNFSVCHTLDTLLEAAFFLKERKDVVFMFIGGGVRVEDVLEYKKKHNLSNIIYLPYQERCKMKYSLSAADMHVVVIGEPFVGIVHPCKIYGILSIGSPFVLIGPIDSHVGEIIEHCKCGYHVSHGDVDKLKFIIEDVRNLNGQAKVEARRINQSLVGQKYARSVLTKKLVEIMY